MAFGVTLGFMEPARTLAKQRSCLVVLTSSHPFTLTQAQQNLTTDSATETTP